MAKTPKPKNSQPPSIHSRAARRQTESTPPPTSKSKTATEEEQPWLYHAQNAGISKKKKVKSLSRRQHERLKRGKENAARNAEVLERKVAESVKRGRKIKSRRGEWEVGGRGKGLDGDVVGDEGSGEDDEDGLAQNGKDGRTWAEKMVEVELEEAMDEIEGFALPTFGDEDKGENRKFEDVEPKAAVNDATATISMDEVDGVT